MLVLPEECKERILQHEIKELARFLTELSVCDYFFVTKNSSSIALAGILNAFDILGESQVPPSAIALFIKRVNDIAGYDAKCTEVEDCRERLRETYYHGGFNESGLGAIVEEEADEKGRFCSPVCVSDISESEPEMNNNTIDESSTMTPATNIIVAPTNLNQEFQHYESSRNHKTLIIDD
jgi:hypothetical protein